MIFRFVTLRNENDKEQKMIPSIEQWKIRMERFRGTSFMFIEGENYWNWRHLLLLNKRKYTMCTSQNIYKYK